MAAMETRRAEAVLKELHRLVAAEPKDADGKQLPLCAEVLARIQEVRGTSWLEPSREKEKELAGLRAEYESAAGDATKMADLDLQLMAALSTSTQVVKDLEAKTARLKAEAIASDEQIWSRAKSNRDGELKKLADALGVATPDLLDILTSSCMATARENGPGWWRRHWMDMLILVAVIAVVSMATVAGIRVGGIPATSAKQLVASRDIAPFEAITAENASPQETARKTGAFVKLDEALNRYPSARIAKGTVLVGPALSAGRLSKPLTDRTILRIPIKPGAPALPWLNPAKIKLVLTPRNAGITEWIEDDVDLLWVESGTDGSVVWVAINSTHLPEIAARLGEADVLFARP
jgi:hypothetical protein